MRELQSRPWFGVLVAVWALLLVALALVAYEGGDATVREQQDIDAARVSADGAVFEVVTAAGQRSAARVSGFELARKCRISVVRDGVDHLRRITLYTSPGGEADLLRRIAKRLPAEHRAEFHGGRGGPRIVAYVDKFVEVRGTSDGAGDGTVEVEIRTGCRPLGDPTADLRTRPTDAERARFDEVFELVGVKPGAPPEWRVESVRCGRDGALRSVRARVATAPDRPLGDAAELAPPDSRVLIGAEDLLAYRQGGLAVVAETRGDTLTVTTTVSDC